MPLSLPPLPQNNVCHGALDSKSSRDSMCFFALSSCENELKNFVTLLDKKEGEGFCEKNISSKINL